MGEGSLLVVEVDSSDRDLVRRVVELVKKGMGVWQAHYAAACLNQRVCRGLAAILEKLVGALLFYSTRLEPGHSLGVIYYVVVEEEYRGMGIGKVLVSSAEYVLESEGVDLVVATARSENSRSKRLFSSLGYVEVPLHTIEEEYGELLTKLTCSYEDDVVFYKNLRAKFEEFVSVLDLESNTEKIEKLWYALCYKPWRELKNRRLF
ncbi:MAG: GNAT family N-acetyltransferase [Sulfolobales archaeon]|nr:GNAT family N-acetyltransferase [Sulfolobales archaeon]MCX8209021.1 GNAT family N-acetyltransferase [Sulfolobales archaeon]MDW8010303.1 GNAT family N-acetyltransferase [Sulfolobales archaeon]